MKINMPGAGFGTQASALRAINGGRATCLNPNERHSGQRLEEGQDLATLQLATVDNLAGSINAVGLRHLNNDSLPYCALCSTRQFNK
jgi:hypothetical protein